MTTTLSGPIVLENPQAMEGSSRTIEFDGQMWLSLGNALTGKFRYFNSSDLTFDDVGHYFAWIHVAKVTLNVNPTETEAKADAEHEEVNDQGSGSATLAEGYHVYGDIVKLLPCFEVMKQPPYITVTGAAFNVNRAEGSFDINAQQYTSFYKFKRHLSLFPIRAHFDDARYKNKKPLPSNNTYVAVEGVITHIDVDVDTAPVLFHINVDNIGFLGKAVLPATPSTQSSPSTPRSSRFRYNFDSTPSHSPQTTSAQSSTTVTTPTELQETTPTRSKRARGGG